MALKKNFFKIFYPLDLDPDPDSDPDLDLDPDPYGEF